MAWITWKVTIQCELTLAIILHSTVEAYWGVFQRELLLKFEAIGCVHIGAGGAGGVRVQQGVGRLGRLGATVLIQVDLPRSLSKGLESTPALGKIWHRYKSLSLFGVVDRVVNMVGGEPGVRETVELEASPHALRVRDGGTSLGYVSSQAVNATFGEVLATLLARVRVSIAVVVQFQSTNKVLENQRVRFATHCASGERGCKACSLQPRWRMPGKLYFPMPSVWGELVR